MSPGTDTPTPNGFERARDTAPGILDWRVLTVGLGGVLLVYYLAPLVALTVSQSPSAVIGRAMEPAVRQAAWTSVVSASASTLLSVAFGLPLAYWLSRAEFTGKHVVLTAVLLPLVLPPIVSGMLLIQLFGPDALGGIAQQSLGFGLTRTLAGVVLAQTFVASPFLVVTAKAAFDGVDRNLEYASRSLGKDRWTTLRNVTLPLAKPGILAGVTLTFARAIGEFGATIMMAYYPRTMPVQIWTAYLSRGIEAALPVAIVLVGVALGTILLLHALGSNPWGGR